MAGHRVRFLKMFSWNIRIIKYELKEKITRHEIDIIAIQETHQGEEQPLTLNEYTVLWNDGNNREVGTAILIKRIIEHNAILSFRDVQNSEATCIEVTLHMP